MVPQLRDSLVNLEKPTFEDDAKEEAAMYKRSLEVRAHPRRVLRSCFISSLSHNTQSRWNQEKQQLQRSTQ